MRRIALALALFFASASWAQSPPPGFVILHGTILDNPQTGTAVYGGAVPLAAGKVCVQPFVKGRALGLGIGGGGQLTTNPICGRVTGGAFSFNVPDTYLTSTQNACLLTTFSDATGAVVRQIPCLQPGTNPLTAWCSTSGGVTSCNLDNYAEPQPTLAIQQPGLPGRDGAPGPQGIPGPPAPGSAFLDGNGNLTVPPAARETIGGGSAHAATDANCSIFVVNDAANVCEHHFASFLTFPTYSPGYGVQQPTGIHALFAGPGANQGSLNGIGSNWRVQQALGITATSYSRGIHDAIAPTLNCYAVGDCFLWDGFLTSDGGATGASDEQTKGQQLHVRESGKPYNGNIAATTGPGDTRPMLAQATSGNNWVTDGTWIQDQGQAGHPTAITGSLNGPSTPFGAYLNQFPVANVTLPPGASWLSTGIAALAVDLINPLGPATAQIVHPGVILTVSSGTFTNGMVEIADGQTETAPITVTSSAPGTQTVTIATRYVHLAGTMIFQGGLANYCLNSDADLAFSQGIAPSSYFVYGGPDLTHLVYGVAFGNTVAGHTLPLFGAEAMTSSGPGAGFHLFPCAEIIQKPAFTILGYSIAGNVASFTTSPQTLAPGQRVQLGSFNTSVVLNSQTLTVNSATPTSFTATYYHPDVPPVVEQGTGINAVALVLQPNLLPLQVGDSIVDPHFMTVSMNGEGLEVSQDSPTNASFGAFARYTVIEGKGHGRGFTADLWKNAEPLSSYVQGGGPLFPIPHHVTTGIFGDQNHYQFLPSWVDAIGSRGAIYSADRTPDSLYGPNCARVFTLPFAPGYTAAPMPSNASPSQMNVTYDCDTGKMNFPHLGGTFDSIQIIDSATSGPNVGVVHTLRFCNGALQPDATGPCN